ncbi:DNA translocase FtsK 4TM domain-containing protein [Candidatus Dependentiae bacterium]|nr:DNA translocase FtsK 4TM domain-containing protein [Candidatus Dependentiae bacterium]
MTKIKQGSPPAHKKKPHLTALNSYTVAVIVALIAVGIMLSLITYSDTDSSYIFSTTAPRETLNILGAAGSNIAAVLLYFFGCSAWVIPLILLYIVRLLLFNLSFKRETDRLSGLCALLFLAPTIAYCYSFECYSGIVPGGWCGGTLLGLLQLIIPQTSIPIFLVMLSWALGVILVRFSSISYLYPLAELIQNLPYKKIALWWHARFTSLFEKKQQPSLPELPVSFEDLQSDFETYIPAIQEQLKEEISAALQPHPTFSPALATDPLGVGTAPVISTPGDTPSYALPPHTLFCAPKEVATDTSVAADGEQRARTLEHKLERFGIKGTVVLITQGPVVTLFEYQPSIDTKISTIIAREDDLALALQALSLRIIAPIPGRSVIGFEVAHNKRKAVLFSPILKGQAFRSSTYALPLVLGKDTLGNDFVIDLASMPHLLVAGSTGSGKSVGLHTMLMSLVCSKTPQEIKFILIDPKRLEFAAYADIPHLLFPIVTDPQRAIAVLKWAVHAMEDRYALMAQAGVRNCAEFNDKIPKDDETYLPLIIIIIDELADLMMTAGKDIETLIARLAQMARAAGIHLICATQRPSVDVITGLIKVNFPSRIAYKVTSKVDSRTILDAIGADKLLGKGDMLFLDTRGCLNRVHGALVTDAEISSVVAHIKAQQKVEYKELTSFKNEPASDEENDEIFQDVINYVKNKDEISISLIQRVFRIGYNRSARIIDQLETTGYILPNDGGKMRKVTKDH